MITQGRIYGKEHESGTEVPDRPRLFVVPTPLGNLEDITLRALRVLGAVDLIACEDTRVTGRLLQHLDIPRKRLMSLHARNEQGRIGEILSFWEEGLSIALVSDAGMPGISDPGTALISAAIAAGVKVEVLPGANAALTAVVGSGLSTRSILFEGFLPHKKGRQTRLGELAMYRETIVLYESPHRILRTLRDLIEHFGADRPAAIGRELTKMYEEYNRDTLAGLLAEYEARPSIKGEFVIVVSGVQ